MSETEKVDSKELEKSNHPETVQNKNKIESKTDEVEIPKTIGLISAISFIVGTVIGSGIFISPKAVAIGSGSIAFSLISWGICGIISMLAAFCYAEMGTVIKASGADYAFLDVAFGSVLSYIFAWCWAMLIKPAAMATLSLTCAQYVLTPLFDDGCGNVPEDLRKIFAVLLLLTLIAINVYSTQLASRIQIIFTFAKLLALVIIIIGGFVKLGQGYTEHLSTGFQGTESNPGTIAIGFLGGMFAYDGWNAANFITEEIINLERNLPLSIFIGVPLTIVVYVLTNVSYFTVMSMEELIASPAVALTWAERVIPPAAWLIPIFVGMSTFGSANGSLFSTSRLIFVTARNGHMPEVFSMVHIKKFSPMPASLLLTLLAIIFAASGNIDSLVKFISFIRWIFYGLNMISLIILRYSKKYKDIKRPVKIPIVIPIIVLIAAIFIVVVPIIADPQIEFLFAVIFVAVGYVFYIPFIHFKLHLGCMKYITMFFQLYIQVSKPKQAIA